MKIHAIRGKNLASLANEFEIDFRKEPLASTGLFAISGPTGAGKSTLFDAMCIALFDETPRLSFKVLGVSLKDVGDETIAPSDSRNLLRRGAAEGFAEVEFQGSDGLDYLARWSVRRSRGKADGKLQDSEMILMRCHDEQRLGAKKKEVKEAIVQRLGLNFHQFTRAVLLAQNEFSAFLKAADNERASLLETLTGTDLYSRLSILSFEREKAEREKLKQIQAQLDSQKPLSLDERSELELQKAAIAETIAQAEAQKSEIEKRLQWHERLIQFKESEKQASIDLAEALAKQSEAEAYKTKLAKIDAAQQARPSVIELDRSKKELDMKSQAQVQAKSAWALALEATQKAESALNEAQSGLHHAEKLKIEAKTDLDAARSLDASIATLDPNHQRAKRTLADYSTELNAVEQKWQQKEADRVQAQDRLKEVRIWLESNRALNSLAPDWSRWDSLLEQAGRVHKDSGLIQALLSNKSESTLQKSLEDAMESSREALAAFQSAQDTYQSAQDQLAQFDANALNERHKSSSESLNRLKGAQAHWQNLSQLQAQIKNKAQKKQEIDASLRKDREALEIVRANKPALENALNLAERSLKLFEAACGENVERLRESLENDAPCPVCGAIEHPYAHENSGLNAELARLQVEVKEQRHGLDRLNVEEAGLSVSIDSSFSQSRELAEALAEQDLALKDLSQTWQNDFEEISHKADPAAWLVETIEHEAEQLKGIDAQQQAMLQANQARDQALKSLNNSRDAQADSDRKLNQARAAFDAIVQEIKRDNEKLEGLNSRLEEYLLALDKAFLDADWRKNWRSNPELFHTEQKASVKVWIEKDQSDQALKRQIELLEAEIEGVKLAKAKALEQFEIARDDFQQIDAQIKAERLKRAALFEGLAVDEVEARFEHAIDETKKIHQLRLDEAQTARIAEIRSQELLIQAENHFESAQNDFEQAQIELGDWLQRLGLIDEALLRDCLSRDLNWIESERQKISAIEDALKKAQAIFEERQKQTQAHEQLWPEPESLDVLKQAHVQALQALKDAQNALSELSLKLRQDDERLKANADYMKQCAAQAEVWTLWAKLNELIGSADGNKFRKFAQQLTLDMLLGYANRHLTELTHRYRLERIKDTLALQVVDRDMGDEIRSVYSLSGGESFLVSMALALGLASLSSNRVKVESLFIDEGFGSLDADTLRIAMDALDNLQSQGRKVGVISHVHEMTERIGVKIQVKRGSAGQSRVYIEGLR